MPSTWDYEGGVEVGDIIGVQVAGTVDVYEVTGKDNLFFVQSASAIAANTTGSFAAVTALEPFGRNLYQFTGLHINGNVRVNVNQPASTNRWGTQQSALGGYLTDRDSGWGAAQPQFLFAFEDFPPNIRFINNTERSITPTVRWYGWSYRLRDLREHCNFEDLGKLRAKLNKPITVVNIGASFA